MAKIKWKIKNTNKFYESSLLQLNNNKAKKILGWKAKLNLDDTIDLLLNGIKILVLIKTLILFLVNKF